ncbi:MAG: hypothetical protein FD189_1191 [Elusimicrobia bacterium]|nr:MAG: hypothetical protein FD154_1572 [Elusimicrobiota bacterium]KAF0156046.1 MAG: hypothetical protein FD189_1191 [Elusimicrobiota bacterium]
MKTFAMCGMVSAAALAALLAACAQPRQAGEAAPSSDLAVTVETREYAVTPAHDQEREDAFMAVLAAAGDQASLGAGMDTGFNYTLKPAGAIYPFSKVEISCRVRGRYAAGQGKKSCSEFFSVLDAKLGKKGFR